MALICDFAAKGWAHELAPATLRLFPTETVGGDLKRRLCDCAWWVQFKDGRSAVLLFEFQSSVDSGMALRTLRYSEAALSVLYGNETLRDPDGGLPLVLSFVVHTGPQRWSAANTVSALAGRRELSPAVARGIGGLGVRHEHAVLDLQWAFAQDLLPEESVLSWLAALEVDPWANLPRVHRVMAEQWGGADCLGARQAFAAWTTERLRAAGVPEAVLMEVKERIEQPREEAEMGQTYAEWAEGHRQQGLEQGLEQGIERGRAEGRAAMLVRVASRRFGAETAEQLAGLVRAMGAEQLARIGDAVVDSETGEELLAAAGNGTTKGRGA